MIAKLLQGRLSRVSIAVLAAACVSSAASAADLGGNCCADLEERIAELEATTVRKGNRKVSLQISGTVAHSVMWWDDGRQSDMYIGDIGTLTSRWRFAGNAKINAAVTAGFTYEFSAISNSLSAANQLNGGDDLGTSGNCNQAAVGAVAPGTNNNSGCAHLRDSTVWLRHNQLGMVKIGYGSTATDNLILIDLGGAVEGGTTPDISLLNGGFILRSKNGLLGGGTTVNWQNAIRGHEAFDTFRRNHVMYESPTLHGFTLSAAYGEDNFWDVALRYAGEFNGVRIAGGVGYSEDTEFNAFHQSFSPTGVTCTQFPPNTTGLGSFCDVKAATLYASGSILHVPSGVFLTAAYADRRLSGTNSNLIGGVTQNYSGPDNQMLYLTGGLSRNFFALGRTVLWADWSRHTGGLAQASFLGVASQTNVATCLNGGVFQGTGAVLAGADAGATCDSTVTVWGFGMQQTIDAAAMTLFASYHNFSLDSNALIGASRELSTRNGGTNDFSVILVGTRINF